MPTSKKSAAPASKKQAAASSQTQAPSGKTQFIVSDDKNPSIKLKPGMKFQVQAVQLVDPTMNAIKAKTGLGRLCGGNNICIALMSVDEEVR